MSPHRLTDTCRPAAFLLLSGWLGACAVERPATAPGFQALEAGRRHASQVRDALADTTSLPSGAEAVSAGYLYRHALGLGSPFRLAEFALRDPRLPPDQRRATALAVLAATGDGQGYRVRPELFGDPALGAAHLRLIQEAIGAAPDPRAGELAVVLGYQLAEAEGAVDGVTRRGAARAAAVLRAGALSREDLRDLLREARLAGDDPLQRMLAWRRARRFRSERPLTSPEAAASEDAAMRFVPGVLDRILAAAPAPAAPEGTASILPPSAARRLLALADSTGGPPRAAVVVPVRRLGVAAEGVPAREAALLARFAARARDEERFAAAHALVLPALASPPGRTRLAQITAEAALAMGAHGQERVWHPGFTGPSVIDLQWRFGLGTIEFSRGVPAGWQPYLLFALEGALSDWLQVFPASTLRGLQVRFGVEGVPPHALAIHSPRTGAIRLPPATGMGSLAHEIAHEMDRVESERRYGSPRRYATDDAVRRRRRDVFAAASGEVLQRAPEEPLAPASPDRAYLSRPAEVFARNVEWYTSSVLADQGRLNGDLVLWQDQLLNGYTRLDRAASADSAAEALAETLLLMVPLPLRDLRLFLARYSPALTPRPAALARTVVRAGRGPSARLARDSAALERWLGSGRREVRRVRSAAAAARARYARCAPGDELVLGLAPARDARLALLEAAEESGVRRVVRQHARALAGEAGIRWMLDLRRRFGATASVPAELATWLRRLEAVAQEAPVRHDWPLTPLRCLDAPLP